MSELPWRMSDRANQDGGMYRDLVEHMHIALEHGNLEDITAGYEYDGGALSVSTRPDDDVALDILHEELGDQAYTMTSRERVKVGKLLSNHGLRWGYGVSNPADQLFVYDAPARMETVRPFDIAVLTGLVGKDVDYMTSGSAELTALINRLDRSPYETRVLLGSAAMVAHYQETERHKGYQFVTMETKSEDGLGTRVGIGADINGDFRMAVTGTFERAFDPFGVEVPYAPVPEHADILGYHTVEPDILRQVILHQAARLGETGLSRWGTVVRERIALSGLTVEPGDFGDWGDAFSSSRLQAKRLSSRLQAVANGARIPQMQLLIWPQRDERLVIDAVQSGLRFRMLDRNGQEVDGHTATIADDAMEDFAVALIGSTFSNGRSGPDLLLTMLESIT